MSIDLLPLSSFAGVMSTRPWHSQATWPTGIGLPSANKTYLAHNAEYPPQTAVVTAYDHTTGTIENHVINSTEMLNDYHGAASIEILSDGRMMIAHGCHNSDILLTLSGQSGGEPDFSSLTTQTVIAGDHTYPKLINIGSGGGAGTLWIISRLATGTNSPLAIRSATYTSGGAVNFGSETIIVDFNTGSGARVYAAEVYEVNGDLEFMVTRANLADTERRSTYFFRYVVATGAVENLSGAVSIASGSLPVDNTEATADFLEHTTTEDTSFLSWCHAPDGNIHVIFGDDTTTAGQLHDVFHSTHNGTSWSTPAVVFTILNSTGGAYVNEFCIFPGPSGDKIEAWYPVGNNGAWTGRGADDQARKKWNGSWSSEEIIVVGDEVTALGHPTGIKNPVSDFRVAFTEVSQVVAESSRTLKKKYGYGDAGFVQWPELSDIYEGCVAFLGRFEGADGSTNFVDESWWNTRHTITEAGAAHIETDVPFLGTSSLKVDGDGDYLSIPIANDDLGVIGHEFTMKTDTIDGWIHLDQLGLTQVVFSTRTGATGMFCFISSSNKMRFIIYNGSVAIFNGTGTTTLSIGVDYYFAIQRSSGNIEFRLGTSGATTQEMSAALTGTPTQGTDFMNIGRYIGNFAYDLNGQMKFRVTKSVLRDISTVPTVDFPAP